ncbi:M23 family metallopeptidase [bacterium]|nr:M23 family metallopeptidase [bacterium]
MRYVELGEKPFYIELKVGQNIICKLKDATFKEIELMDISDSWIEIKVDNIIRKISLGHRTSVREKLSDGDVPQVQIINGVRIGAEITKYYRGLNRYSDSHLNLSQDARLHLSDPSYPLNPKGDYVFPVPNIKWNYADMWLRKVPYGYHVGIDILCPVGTPIVAVTAGKIIALRQYSNGKDKEDFWGKEVALLGEDRLVYSYSHFDRWASHLTLGSYFKTGQKIGEAGRTGFETMDIPPHLHFEIFKLKFPIKVIV